MVSPGHWCTVKPLIYGAPNSKLKCYSSRLAVVFAQTIEARCLVENEDMVEAAPTDDAATASEWSTFVLPTKMRLILEVWWQLRLINMRKISQYPTTTKRREQGGICVLKICFFTTHFSDVTLSSRITGDSIVCPTACSDHQQRESQRSASLVRWEGNRAVTGEFPSQKASNSQKVFPCIDVFVNTGTKN